MFDADSGRLAVVAQMSTPFVPVRVFTVVASRGSVRGEHAHRSCSQLLVCLTGEVVVACSDGLSRSTFRLSEPEDGLLIRPRIWSTQSFAATPSVLLVLCDEEFSEPEYIRDWGLYLEEMGHQ